MKTRLSENIASTMLNTRHAAGIARIEEMPMMKVMMPIRLLCLMTDAAETQM